MARNTAHPPYTAGSPPGDLEALRPWLADEFRRIQTTLDTVVRMAPQVTTAAPKVLLDGMIRLSRSPWRPAAGQVADAWVYYDLPTATWKFL